MSGDHHHNEPTTPSTTTIDKSRKDESNGGGVVVVSSSSSFPINSLPTDILILIFEYIPQYPRIRVVKFVSKRFHSAVYSSFKAISSRDFLWNWKFVLPRFPSITSLSLSFVHVTDLPDALPPRLATLLINHFDGRCNCDLIEKTSSLASLYVMQWTKCPPLDRLISNSLESITFLSLSGYVAPPSTLYLPSLRHLVTSLAIDKGLSSFIVNHASQLTRLECFDVSFLHQSSFPMLRYLDVSYTSNDNTSFLKNCPSLTQLNIGLSSFFGAPDPLFEVLPLLTTIACDVTALFPSLHFATRLTAIDSYIDVDEHTIQHLSPVASRLKRLALRSNLLKNQDCAAVIALCPMLEDLSLHKIKFASNASLSLPHLEKLQLRFVDNAIDFLNKFLVVAPRLRQVRSIANEVDQSHLGSFLQAAEKAGVERVELIVKDDVTSCKELIRSLNLQWLYVR